MTAPALYRARRGPEAAKGRRQTHRPALTGALLSLQQLEKQKQAHLRAFAIM